MSIWRTIRVFISSTFRDMHAERDHLVRVVFPSLRERLLPFRVELIDIDLRWGITREQAEDERVIELCLQQSEECELFFGLLGGRYGWVPETIPTATLERFAWLREHVGISVTEMEIRHGVLNADAPERPTGFCVRDESATADVPDAIREEIYAERDPKMGDRLSELKRAIREHGCPVAGPYPCRWDDYAFDRSSGMTGKLVDLDEFGRLVEAWLWEAVRTHLGLTDSPPEGEVDPLDEEREQHARFAEQRRRHFVGREELLTDIEKYAHGDVNLPCLLSGPSGSGKSATLAEFARRFAEKHRDVYLLTHFIGASPTSTSLRETLGRLCGELKQEFGFGVDIPDSPHERATVFRGLLASIPEDRRAVLVIDAPNQLDAEGGAHVLHWLPEELPEHVRIVVGCVDEPGGEIQRALAERGWHRLRVEPLSDAERVRILREVPKVAAKTLDAAQTTALLSNQATHNPLFLLVALEELRVFGSFDKLNERIAGLPSDDGALTDLFEQVFERLEDEFDTEFVERVLTSLGAARFGLSEPELRVITADLKPGHELFALIRQLRPYLLSRDGRLAFYHANPRLAVEQRYLKKPLQRREAHFRLAKYFGGLPLGRRKVEELPWQLSRAEAWLWQAGLFADLEFLHAAWEANEFEVRERWAEIEARSPLRMVSVYRDVLENPEPHSDRLGDLTALLFHFGQGTAASRLWECQIRYCRDKGNLSELHGCLGNQALIYKATGEVDRAMELLIEQEQICRQLSDPAGLSACLGNQALIYKAKGDLDRAMELHAEEERICRQLDDPIGLQACLGNQALINRAKGDLERAMELLIAQERIYRQLGDPAGLQRSLGNQALIHKAKRELDRAMELHAEEERICRQLGDPAGLSASLGNQALIRKAKGELDRAMELHAEEERICRQLSDPAGLQRSLGNQALIQRAKGDLDRAMELLIEQERICRQLGNPNGIAISLINQASIRAFNQGDPQAGLPLAEEAFALANRHGLTALAEQIRPILERIRRATDGE